MRSVESTRQISDKKLERNLTVLKIPSHFGEDLVRTSVVAKLSVISDRHIPALLALPEEFDSWRNEVLDARERVHGKRTGESDEIRRDEAHIVGHFIDVAQLEPADEDRLILTGMAQIVVQAGFRAKHRRKSSVLLHVEPQCARFAIAFFAQISPVQHSERLDDELRPFAGY